MRIHELVLNLTCAFSFVTLRSYVIKKLDILLHKLLVFSLLKSVKCTFQPSDCEFSLMIYTYAML